MAPKAMAIIIPDSHEYFESAKELLAVDDYIEEDVGSTLWPGKIRVRGLTVPQREKINRYAGVGEARDWEKFYAKTFEEGFVRPRLSSTEATTFVRDHFGEDVEALGDAIWSMEKLHDTIRRYQEAQRDLKAAREVAASVGSPES